MSLNIGKTSEEQKRIDSFMGFMGRFVETGMVKDLQEKGFFIAPASIHHHGQYEGALFDHSYEVAKALLHLTAKLGLTWQRERSPFIVGMFHDLCKLDNYVKSDHEEWEYNNATLLPGHGKKKFSASDGIWEPLTIRRTGTVMGGPVLATTMSCTPTQPT